MATVYESSGVCVTGVLTPTKVKMEEPCNKDSDPTMYGNIQEYLAREVKQYPCLYNVFCKDYKNVRQKERCWREIGSRLGMDAEVCRAKWRNIRDRYVKEMRKERAGCTSTTAKPWPMIPKLRFLDVSVNRRKSLSEDTSEPMWDSSLLLTPPGPASHTRLSSTPGEQLEQEAAPASLSPEHLASSSQDGDISFLLSMLPQLRRIPDRRKNLLKIEMLQMMHKYEFESS